jgi:hypothetical protein
MVVNRSFLPICKEIWLDSYEKNQAEMCFQIYSEYSGGVAGSGPVAYTS